ncbi:MAG: GAF domain-containing sensor histidine kinase, partial [Myxococcales bacterium]|nr:GAF domain-containing sensor histidine kinase [Myxococcales bacterium]
MQAPPIPDDEHQRLRALARYAILDTAPEESFDELTALAAEICGTPIALVSLVDRDRQWFKSRVGIDALETPRELAFCAHAILDDAVMEVPNALEDPRFADNPLVTGAPDIRFYAGAPLVTNDGHRIGTLCVIDRIPKQLTQTQLRALRTLGRQVIDLLELRHAASSLARELLKAEGASRSRESAADDAVKADASAEHRAFLARVIHDLRTPLNAILGFSEYLREDEPIADDERQEIAEKIGDAGQFMLGLVNDILDLAHLESGEFRFNAEPIDLGALAGATLDGLRPLAHAGGNQTRLEVVDAAAASIVGDGVRIRQVLANLLSNACKYTHDGEIRVRISADGDRWARIDVVDTGIGMNDEQRRRLFRPFSQVQEAGKQSREGTGLGLQITRGLCEGMGGAIAVESAPGLGTVFSVWLPRAPYPAPKGQPI